METGNCRFAFSALVALLFLAGITYASVNPKVQLESYELSEVPAEPGHAVALTLMLKSIESDNCAERVAVQLAVSYPLSIAGSDTQYIDSLCFRDPKSKGTLVFLLPIDNLAVSGTYPVSVSTTYEKRFTKLSESNIINLQVMGAAFFKSSVSSSDPADIYPGDSAKVTVSFQNAGSSMVQSARASAASKGITVKWAGQTQDVGQISARSSATATFEIEAPKDLPAGSYPLDVLLEYVGENRSQNSARFTYFVPVKPKAEFRAAPATEGMLAGQKSAIAISLANTGSQEARQLKVRIRPLYPFSTDGTVRYLESLAAGGGSNLTYMITVDKDATPGGQLLGLIVDYEDSQGRKFSDSADFALNVRTPTILEEITAYWYVFALLALGAGAYLKTRKIAKK